MTILRKTKARTSWFFQTLMLVIERRALLLYCEDRQGILAGNRTSIGHLQRGVPRVFGSCNTCLRVGRESLYKAAQSWKLSRHQCLYILTVLLAMLTSLNTADSQVFLPRIVEHPELRNSYSYCQDAWRCDIIDDMRADPIDEFGGVSLNIWTFSGSPWAWWWGVNDCDYDDIDGLLNEGYILGTFAYYPCLDPPGGYPPDDPNGEPWDELDLVAEHQIPMGARMVIVDELAWRRGTTAEEFIYMSDVCKAANPDVIFIFSDTDWSDRIEPVCDAIEDALASEQPPRALSGVIDVVMNMSTLDNNTGIYNMTTYAESKNLKTSMWIFSIGYMGTSENNFPYYLRKAYYNLSALHIFHRPCDMDWSGEGGVREYLERMLHHRVSIELDDVTCVSAFDSEGYAATDTTIQLAPSSWLVPSTDDEVVVRSGTRVVALLDADTIYLKGKRYEGVVGNLDSISSACFRVRNASGTTMAAINSESFDGTSLGLDKQVPAGSLMLKKRLIARQILQ